MDEYTLRSAKTINTIRLILFGIYVLGILGSLGSIRKDQLLVMVTTTVLYGALAFVQLYLFRKKINPYPFWFVVGDVILVGISTWGQSLITLDLAAASYNFV